jgi:hypothetical protein
MIDWSNCKNVEVVSEKKCKYLIHKVNYLKTNKDKAEVKIKARPICKLNNKDCKIIYKHYKTFLEKKK